MSTITIYQGSDSHPLSDEQVRSIVLRSFNTVDPLGVGDEYRGYAVRFIKSLRETHFSFNDSLREKCWHTFISELVRRSFGPVQIAESWVRQEAIEEIAWQIQHGGITADTTLD